MVFYPLYCSSPMQTPSCPATRPMAPAPRRLGAKPNIANSQPLPSRRRSAPPPAAGNPRLVSAGHCCCHPPPRAPRRGLPRSAWTHRWSENEGEDSTRGPRVLFHAEYGMISNAPSPLICCDWATDNSSSVLGYYLSVSCRFALKFLSRYLQFQTLCEKYARNKSGPCHLTRAEKGVLVEVRYVRTRAIR